MTSRCGPYRTASRPPREPSPAPGSGAGAGPCGTFWWSRRCTPIRQPRSSTPSGTRRRVPSGARAAFPQRRGRGRSEGLYDEGFDPDRGQGYTCDTAASLHGADRALADVAVSVAALRRRTDVARGPVLIGGVSRGGALAIAFAGRNPELVGGVLNFVGGWIGTGCGTATEINGTLFREGGRYRRPTLWLYGNGDRYYPISHSSANFNLFRQSGGVGQFLVFDVPGGEGHAVASHKELWLEPVRTYLGSVGRAPSP